MPSRCLGSEGSEASVRESAQGRKAKTMKIRGSNSSYAKESIEQEFAGERVLIIRGEFSDGSIGYDVELQDEHGPGSVRFACDSRGEAASLAREINEVGYIRFDGGSE